MATTHCKNSYWILNFLLQKEGERKKNKKELLDGEMYVDLALSLSPPPHRSTTT